MGLIVKGLAASSFVTLLVVGAALLYLFVGPPPAVPRLESTWWGPRDPQKEDTNIVPFKINVSDQILKDLKTRLENAIPFQESLQGTNQDYGINSDLLTQIVDFWKTKYNWREREKFLNQYPQYTVSVQGLKIHYIHVKPKDTQGRKVLPLLLLHGWPGSVREFYEIIPLLTTPQKDFDFVFEVIVPSLPGYGFSEAAVRPGLGAGQMAVLFNNFMQKLKFNKYYLQGGDWGGVIAQHMSVLFPEKVIGLHSNACWVLSALGNFKLWVGAFLPSLITEEYEQPHVYPLSEKYSELMLELGYMHLQATKPDTVGIALRDSPVGLAAYILEKFTTWTNKEWRNLKDGGLTKKFTMTDLLDNVMIYWVTRSITTSQRLYSESFNKAGFALKLDELPVTVPTGCSRFVHDLVYSPKSILQDKFTNLVQLSDFEGGHFAAFEAPGALAGDVWSFVKKVEDEKNGKKTKSEL